MYIDADQTDVDDNTNQPFRFKDSWNMPHGHAHCDSDCHCDCDCGGEVGIQRGCSSVRGCTSNADGVYGGLSGRDI